MNSWRDELKEAVKSKAEREQEEQARKRKRLEEALQVAREALDKTAAVLGFTHELLVSKEQPSTLAEDGGITSLKMHDMSLLVGLSEESAVLKVTLNEGHPREFDFSKDRHLSPKDVEEYVGRRAVELARAAQQKHPW